MKRDRLLAQTSARLRQAGYLRKWLVLGVVIGIVAGLGAIAFTAALRWATEFFLNLAGGYTPPAPAGEGATVGSGSHLVRPWALPLIVGLGGLISGILVFSLAPEAEGHGTDAAIAAVHHNPRGIRARVSFVKIVASAITIGSGGSAGREGPTAQISAGFGSMLARWLDLTPSDARIAVTVGIGSGIGAIFRAPLGGAVLGAEVLYREDVEADALIPSLVASIVGFAVFGAVDGFNPIFATPGGYHFDHPAELIYYAVIGVAAGLLGRLYATSFYGVAHLTRRLPGSRMLKPAVGGVLVGLMAIADPGDPRHRVRMGPDRDDDGDHDHSLVGDPGVAVRQDPRHVALHRFRGIGGDLRSGHGDRRLPRGGRVATDAGSSRGAALAGAVRGGGDDRVLRKHRPRPASGDADGRRDDRQPRDACPGDGCRRTRHRHRRRSDDLREPASEPGRGACSSGPIRPVVAGSSAYPRGDAAVSPRLGRRCFRARGARATPGTRADRGVDRGRRSCVPGNDRRRAHRASRPRRTESARWPTGASPRFLSRRRSTRS